MRMLAAQEMSGLCSAFLELTMLYLDAVSSPPSGQHTHDDDDDDDVRGLRQLHHHMLWHELTAHMEGTGGQP